MLIVSGHAGLSCLQVSPVVSACVECLPAIMHVFRQALDEELLAVLRAQLLDPVVHSLDAALRLLQHRPSGRPPDDRRADDGAPAGLTEARLQAAAVAGGSGGAEVSKPVKAPSVAPYLALPPLLLGRRAVFVRCQPEPTVTQRRAVCAERVSRDPYLHELLQWVGCLITTVLAQQAVC